MGGLSIPTVLVSYLALLFSLSVHEASHATCAYLLDDHTAADQGRMTLNPLAHATLIGTVIFPLAGMLTGWPFIGWAKPVPVNPANLTRRFRMRTGYAMVSAAGPASNFAMMLIFLPLLCLMVRGIAPVVDREVVLRYVMFGPVDDLALKLGIGGAQGFFMSVLGKLVIINLVLALFNLLPFGPLDGAGIMRGFIPDAWLPIFDRATPVLGVVLILVVITPLGDYVIGPIFGAAFEALKPISRVFLGA